MVIVQKRVLGPICQQVMQSPAPPADRDHQKIDNLVIERVPDRSITAKTPDFFKPTGTCTLSDSLEQLFRNYERLTQNAERTPQLRGHISPSPVLSVVTQGAYDSMDGFQWALACAAHNERHLRQIEEAKQHPKYPAAN